jgi:hypothetical protein
MKKYMIENTMVFPMTNTVNGQMRIKIAALAISNMISEAEDKLEAAGVKYRIDKHGFFTITVPYSGISKLLTDLGVYERFGATE